MRNSSGAKLTSLNDGAVLRSRIGLRGSERTTPVQIHGNAAAALDGN